MKVPGYKPMQVAPEGARLPARAVTHPGGFDALQRAGNQLGAAAESAAKVYEQYRHQAEVTDATNLITKYQQADTEEAYGSSTTPEDNGPVPDVTKMSEEGFAKFLEGPKAEQKPGFLSSQGEYALQGLDEHLTKLEKRRQEIAKEAKSEGARKKYLAETAGMFEGARKRAHGHVAGEIEHAKRDAEKNSLAATLKQTALEPLDEELATRLVAGTAGRAAALATSPEDADAKVDAIRAEVAKNRAETLIEMAKEEPALWDAAENVVKGSEAQLGQTATGKNGLYERIRTGKSGAEVQSIAAGVTAAAKSDHVFNPIDIGTIEKGLAQVPEAKRAKVANVVDEMVGRDARRVKAEKERFVDAAKTQYGHERAAFFESTTAKVLLEVDPDTYFALEDRLKSASRVARAEGRERLTLQTNLDKMALDDLRAQLEANPKLDTNRFLQEHPELSGGRVNEVNALAAKAAKVYDQGLKPTQDRFVSDFMAEAGHKMPVFTGTPQQVREQQRAWKSARRAEAVDLYTDAMDANKGEKPEPEALTAAKAQAILDLPLTTINPGSLGANTRAITNLGAPPARVPDPPAGIRATGQTVTMPDGSVYAVMSDKSTRLLTPAKKKAKK